MEYRITGGRARVWLAPYRAIFAADEAEAVLLATRAALRDVPEATVEVWRVHRTPTGRYSVTLRRTRPA